MDTSTYILIGVFFGLPIIIGVIGGIVKMAGGKQRAKEMHQLAASMNLSFHAKGDHALVSSLTQLPLFSDGRNHCARNVLHGRINDIDVTIMDYEYATGTAGSGSSARQFKTVIEFKSSLLRLPSFTLTPQGWLHNIAVNMGAPDINFDSHPTFSRQSLLIGADEESIRRAFAGEVLEFYEHRGQWSTAGDGTRFLIYKSSKRLPPGEITSFIAEGFELFNLLKAES